jgi:hypothetical protein
VVADDEVVPPFDSVATDVSPTVRVLSFGPKLDDTSVSQVRQGGFEYGGIVIWVALTVELVLYGRAVML